MKSEPNFEVIKIDTEPKKLRIISDVYLVFNGYKYLPYIDVLMLKTKKNASISASAQSISKSLEIFRADNNGIIDLEIWLNRETDDQRAKYIVATA